ncbi:MAG: glycosyl transferase family 1, partial [Solirubrobacterales bacterium]|nr:glycosyl transferase family 1 [Solirubrobacterales bacterium]
MESLPLVHDGALDPTRFEEVLDQAHVQLLREGMRRAQGTFDGRVVWHVNSTARGGGVAEMLHPLLSYARGAGVDTRWAVIQGDDAFFRVTKRIHNFLHGDAGDGGALDA